VVNSERLAMQILLELVALFLIFVGQLWAQQAAQPHAYIERAVIQHQSGTATVTANSGRPLSQALRAIRAEYGWVIDYEDPLYKDPDLTTYADPRMPARLLKVPAGGAFQSSYPETPYMWSRTDDERPVLDKIVSDYNQSGNPGRFIVRAQSDGSYAAIGDEIADGSGGEVPVKPILDTLVSVPTGTRTLGATFFVVAGALSGAAGIPVVASPGFAVSRDMLQANVTVGGSEVPARSLLLQAFTQLGAKIAWDLRFDAPSQGYVLNLMQVVRAGHQTFGGGAPIPIQQ
jgi:hypothetical protein